MSLLQLLKYFEIYFKLIIYCSVKVWTVVNRRKRETGINPKKWVESIIYASLRGNGTACPVQLIPTQFSERLFFLKSPWIDTAGSEQISRFKSARETWKPLLKPGVN